MGSAIAPVGSNKSSITSELGQSTTGPNISLRALSSSAGKASPDGMAEFYGYSYISRSFSGSQIIYSPNTTTSGMIIVTGASTNLYCTAFGGSTSGCTSKGTMNVGTTSGGTQIGTRTTAIYNSFTSGSSSVLVVPVGTYFYQINAVYTGSSSGGQSVSIG